MGIVELMGMSFGDPEHINAYKMMGNPLSVIANRLSYASTSVGRA